MTQWNLYKPTEKLKTKTPSGRGGKKKAVLEKWMSLDTETSHNHDPENPIGWIYQWAFKFCDDIVIGRKPSELMKCLREIVNFYNLNPENRLVIYVHNLSYDWVYLADWLEKEFGKGKMLAIKSHHLISYENSFFIFKCSYMLSNKSLAKWSKDLNCLNRKLEGFVDYEVERFQDTKLTKKDWDYMIADVVTLHECIEKQLALYDDTIITVPLTSTGYIRRELRKNFSKDNHNFKRFSQTRLNATTYSLCRREYAGGFTHGDRFQAGFTVIPEENQFIKHRDFRSHYPSQQRAREFPIGKFIPYDDNMSYSEIMELTKEYCILVEVEIKNILIKNYAINFPYLQESKCREGRIGKCHTRSDNGRILEYAGTTVMVFNEHDLYWYHRQYIQQEIKYRHVYVSKKGFLPKWLTETVDNFMLGKTKFKKLAKLETDIIKKIDYELSLMKSKNGLNSVYGCSSTDPIRSEVTMSDMENWDEIRPENIQECLDKFYSNRNNCMRFCWGCWTTSHARNELFTFAYDIIGKANGGDGTVAEGCLYMDTDSIFYISNNETEIAVENYNKELRERSEKIGAYIEYDGEIVHYDQFCDEEENISSFRFLHSKCYAYMEDGKLHCTIAGVPARTIIGLNENEEPIYYTREEELGNIENLKPMFVFTTCGGASISYHYQKPNIKTIKGHKTEYASSGIISKTTKTLKHECEKHLEILEQLAGLV